MSGVDIAIRVFGMGQETIMSGN